ncbi:ABC-type metal ion transporter, periplasmic subunit [Calothrix sp. PCC 7716]|nr:ABC-type metal ion transporter, periplasmic subunit [Calothrix sp. PCC 7716]
MKVFRGVERNSFWGAAFIAVALSITGCAESTPTSQATASPEATSAASPAANTSTGKLKVVASYSVPCNLVQEVAQDKVDLNCLIEPAQDPHVYEATPKDRQAIDEANIVFYGGIQFEPAIVDMVQASKSTAPKIALNEIAAPAGERLSLEEDGKKEEDPHVWHDVKNGIDMVEAIRTNLAKVDSANADFYNKNADALVAKLKKLDAWVPQQIATIPANQRRLVTTHDALGYFAKAYGLKVEGTLVGVSTEEEPTAAKVKSLSDGIKKAKVPTIFAELTANDKVLKTVAKEANVKISERPIVADGLGDKGTPEATYVGMIESNTCTIVNNLGGKCTAFKP